MLPMQSNLVAFTEKKNFNNNKRNIGDPKFRLGYRKPQQYGLDTRLDIYSNGFVLTVKF